MTHASLFSGIGGFDIAAEWAGWDNVFNCEIADFPRKVLNYHFPNAVQYDDIKSTDFTVWRGRVDVLTGGFPCQPFSTAGKRKGTEDDRYLWPEMLRAIREIRPRWVVGENVLGIVNWNRGMVFEQVHVDLETEGYEVQAFVLPACSVGAPHRRDRTWFVAHAVENTGRDGRESRESKKEGTEIRQDCIYATRTTPISDINGLEYCFISRTSGEVSGQISKSPSLDATSSNGGRRVTPYSDGERRYMPSGANTPVKISRRTDNGQQEERKRAYNGAISQILKMWEVFPTQSPVCSRDDGFPLPMDGITFPKWRAEAINAYGNAIVPQVAYRIFDTINKYERL